MNKKKRFLGLMLLMVMTVGLLGGCGSNNNAEKESPTATDASVETNSANSANSAIKDPYEIVMAMPVFGAVSEEYPLIEGEINKIIQPKINATVKILPIGIGSWQQQTNLMSSGGEKLDTYYMFGVSYASDVSSGKVVALSDLMNKYGENVKKQFEPEYLNSAMINGEIYGIPSLKDYTTGIPGVAMRKDLVEKYKIDIAAIKSINDLDTAFQVIKDNEPTISPLGIGLTVPGDQYFSYDKLNNKFGVLPNFDNNLKVENLFETKEYEEYLNTLNRWFKAGYINKDAATNGTSGTELMKAGKIFSYFISNRVGMFEQENRVIGKEMVFVPLSSELYSTTSDVLAGLWGISANSTNPERTMMFLDLLYTNPEIANLLLWGIEGKHYIKNDNGTVDYPEGLDSSTVGYANQNWLIGNAFMTHPFKNDSPDKWELTAEANKKATKSKALGFSFNEEPVKNEITALNNVIGQYWKALETGTIAPADKLEEFRTKLKAAGIDKVIAEKQKQLDAWAAAKQ